MGIGINIILAVGTNLVVGFSGQFSLGHAGFMAIGAYATAIIDNSKSYLCCFLFIHYCRYDSDCRTVALVVGIPTLRLKGDYLAIATLGVSEIIRNLIENGGDLTNGAAGILGIPQLYHLARWSIFSLLLTTIFELNFLRSPMGRASTLSVREDEIAAEVCGGEYDKN